MNCPVCGIEPDYFIVSRGSGNSFDFCLKKPEQMTEEFIRENPRFSCITCERKRADAAWIASMKKLIEESKR